MKNKHKHPGQGKAGLDTSEDEAPEEFYKPYEEYAKTLRAWLAAYGVGAPVLFLGNEKLWNILFASGHARAIGSVFLFGVLIQVCLSLLNKYVNWTNYSNGNESDKSLGWWGRKCRDTEQLIWVDIVSDLATVLLFVIATTWAVSLLP